MFLSLKTAFIAWTYQIKHIIREDVVDLEPQGYCAFAAVIISFGFMMMSGRR